MRKLLIVGTTPLADRLIDAVEADPAGRYTVVGVVGERSGPTTLTHACAVVGVVAEIDALVQRLHPDTIALALEEGRGSPPLKTLIQYRISRGVVVEDSTEMCERLTGAVAMDALWLGRLILSGHCRLPRRYFACTRAMSIIISLAALIALSPLLLLIAAAIALDSDGPIVFAQLRGGRAGRAFTLLKFRTMRAGDGHGSEWVQDNSDRITRVGRWLRKYRLDELPQFVNVLRGDMNLVGPRPHPVSNIGTLREMTDDPDDVKGIDTPFYTLRMLVRPGITGWAQVRYGYANNFDQEIEKLRYDLYYIKRLSLSLDLRILFETVRVVLYGHDAELLTLPVPVPVVRLAV